MKFKTKPILFIAGFVLLLPLVLTGVAGATYLGVHNIIGCTGCHNIHDDTYIDDTECTTCHTKSLTQMNHLTTIGTPAGIAIAEGNGAVACKICHMPEKIHLWTVSTDTSYTTFPTGVHDAYTENDFVDIDLSCGQCHGGADNQFDNPPLSGVPYRSKASLAIVAEGIHASAGVSYPVTFMSSVTPNTLEVNVDATVNCGGACPPLSYDWDWGDGEPNGTGDPATHTYASAGAKTIKLTVSIAEGTVGSVTRSVFISNPDLPPAAGAACVWNANTWTMDVTDISTDDGPDGDADDDTSPVLAISVDWGDVSAKSYGIQADAFSHIYSKTGTFTVSLKATDVVLQNSTTACAPVTSLYFTIDGTVKKSVLQGGGNLTYATAQLLNSSGTVIKSVSTGTTGTFSFGNLKPGTYKIQAKKTAYTFPAAAAIVVGPSSSGNVIQALTP